MKLLDQLVEERAEISEAQTGLVTRAADEERDLTETEDTNLKELATRAEELDTRIAELRAVQVANLEAAKLRAEVSNTDDTEYRAVGNVVVKDEPLQYREGGEHDFFVDLYHAQIRNEPAAWNRLHRHQQETATETRDSSTSNFAGLVPPHYAIAMALEKARASRPFADACNRQPLPETGMDVVITRLTTGASTTAQSSENSAIAESSPDDTTQTIGIKSYAANVDVSAQALARGVGISNLLVEDMVASYAQALDADLIDGSGSSGKHTGALRVSGIQSESYTAGTATGAGLYEKILKGINLVQTAIYKPATLITMHPRRWAWFVGKGLDGDGRPLVLPSQNVPTNAMGIGNMDVPQGVVGQIAGVGVLLDPNIPTDLGSGSDEDAILITNMSNTVLWEDSGAAPNVVSFDQTNAGSLTVKFVSWGYSAFALKDPAGMVKIVGTGLNDTL